MTAHYFFDASAMIRTIEQHPSFEEFRDEPVVTDRGHVYELARHLVKSQGARVARTILAALHVERIEAIDEDLIEAAKLSMRHASMSGQDALGYVLARRARLKFLTTDRAFVRLPGTRYIDIHAQ